MNMMTADPAAPIKLWADMMRMAFEAQYVMGMRLAAMAGVLPQRRGENYRMVAEKSDAARESVGAALRLAARGARPDEILAAALRPYGQRTRANARRLSRR
ncbi:antibiotic ABC transporter [Paracoccus contaminans]|nr:antibiotic ABC transporter [Paracoccus contaminans]